MKKRVLIVFGTRPEALKFVPVIKELRKQPTFECKVCITGQHKEMLDQVIRFFKVPVDLNLDLMRSNQTLAHITKQILTTFEKMTRRWKPDLIFVQGDTTTAFVVALASFYQKIPIAHLEAGLRTNDKFHPYPEEINRRLISQVADYHFTPTKLATANLLREGVDRRRIFEVGNTIVDTVTLAVRLVKKQYSVFKDIDFSRRIIFVTAHRRESFGEGLTNICRALKKIAAEHLDVEIVYPVHMNPNVLRIAKRVLSKTLRVHLLRPITYEETSWLLGACDLLLTDSGGLQEEAPSYGKPVLVLRKVTERPEGVEAGIAKLVGTNQENIVATTRQLLTSDKTYRKMCAKVNPYGDGKSSQKIMKHLKSIFNVTAPKPVEEYAVH